MRAALAFRSLKNPQVSVLIIILILTWVAVFIAVASGGPTLALLGWDYTSAGSGLTNVHPATYAFIALAPACLLASAQFRRIFKDPIYLAYLAVATGFLIWTWRLSQREAGGGELTIALVTYLTPAIALIPLQGLAAERLNAMGSALRIFIAGNSLMALVERVIGHRFIPSGLDMYGNELRATALFGHPLAGALITGMVLINLLTSRARRGGFLSRAPEIGLHGLALFAYGGRSSIIFVALIAIFSSLHVGRARGQANISFVQRLTPYLAVLALGIIALSPIKFVQDTLDRFTSSSEGATSTSARLSAFDLLSSLTPHEFYNGVLPGHRQLIMNYFGTGAGVEISFIALIFSVGAVAGISMMIACLVLALSRTRGLDRSAFFMVVFFIIVTGTANSIGGKSPMITVLFVLIFTMSQLRSVDADLEDLSSTSLADDSITKSVVSRAVV